MEITISWRFIVGIDLAKKHLDVHLFDRKTPMSHSCQVPNTPEGFTQLARWLENQGADKSQTKLISEHTGRYGERLLGWTTETGWPHAVVKTTALKKVSGEHQRKTDEFDAEKLAEYGRRFGDRLPLTEVQKPAIEQIKRLQAERRKMVDRRAALKSKRTEAHFHEADMERIIAMWKQQVQLLTKHIDEMEDRIRKLISSDQHLTERHKTMQTAPGMGKVLGALWLSLFAGQDQINPRKISSRFGFAPHPHRSGSSVRSPDRSTGFGNAEMRRVMHQAALSVKRNYPHYHEYYHRKKAEGKHHLLIINNIINKLIRLYCAMWNNRTIYDPDYIRKGKKKFEKSA